jgi:Tol biopolymer transport system component
MLEESPVRGRLDSWKEIAAYLNRDVRTVIRWEQEKALPVHRVPGGKRQAVFAYKDEIEAWLAGSHANGNHVDGNHPEGNLANGNYSEGIQHAIAPAAATETAEPLDDLPPTLKTSETAAVPESHQKSLSTLYLRSWKLVGLLIGLLVLAGVTVALLPHSSPSAPIRPIKLKKLTDDGRAKGGNLRTDGTTLYFNQQEGGRTILASAPTSGSPIRRIATPFSNVALQDLSPDGQALLVLSYEKITIEGPLWAIPAKGGTPRRVGNAVCNFARWSPDNRRIACADKTKIAFMDIDGSNPQTIASFSMPVSQITWTPNGDRLLYVLDDTTAHTSSQWEIGVAPDGTVTKPRQLQLGTGCCMDWTWTGDHKVLFYIERDAGGKTHLMVQTERLSQPTELPVDIGPVWPVVAGKTGNSLYLAIGGAAQAELLKFDSRQKAFETMLPGLSADYLSFSPDGQWMTYTDVGGGSLWRSRADGSQPLKLASSSMEVEVSSWSPDGRHIAFMGQEAGRPYRIYLVDRNGGPVKEASEGDDNQGGPSWSPDGKTIVYGNVFCEKTQDCWIRRLDLATRKTEIIPGSNGLRTARWSPDGKYIAALRFQSRELMVFDISRHRWRVLAESVGGDNINWSSDSKSVYVDSPRDKTPVIERIYVSDGRRVTAVSLAALQNVPGTIETWVGLTPDNSPILTHVFTSSEIYRLDWTDR